MSVEHSGTKDDNEDGYGAKNAIDLNYDTESGTVKGSDSRTWLKINLAQVYCVSEVIEFNSDVDSIQYSWHCSDTSCPCKEGQGTDSSCSDFTLSVSIEGTPPIGLSPDTSCKYGDTVTLEYIGRLFYVSDIAVIGRGKILEYYR